MLETQSHLRNYKHEVGGVFFSVCLCVQVRHVAQNLMKRQRDTMHNTTMACFF